MKTDIRSQITIIITHTVTPEYKLINLMIPSPLSHIILVRPGYRFYVDFVA